MDAECRRRHPTEVIGQKRLSAFCLKIAQLSQHINARGPPVALVEYRRKKSSHVRKQIEQLLLKIQSKSICFAKVVGEWQAFTPGTFQ